MREREREREREEGAIKKTPKERERDRENERTRDVRPRALATSHSTTIPSGGARYSPCRETGLRRSSPLRVTRRWSRGDDIACSRSACERKRKKATKAYSERESSRCRREDPAPGSPTRSPPRVVDVVA